MLKSLSISNLAVISQLSVDFYEGLNLLTGETGAGKSIIVDAFALLLGARAASDLVRTGEQSAVVEAVFELDESAERSVREKLSEIGLVLSEEEFLTIRREVNVTGRNRIFINDKNVTLATLKSLQPFLVEIHGQGEQRSLFDPRAQLSLLDGFGGCEELREKLRGVYLRWRELASSLEALGGDARERERMIELLRYQVEEIERLGVQTGEEDALRKERRLLLNAERISDLSGGAYSSLYERDDSVLASLAAVRKNIRDLLSLDSGPASLLESVEGAELLLKDVAEELRRYRDGISYGAERLAWVENRLTELERMKRKYVCETDELGAVREKLQTRLEEFTNWSERQEELREELSSVGREYAAHARRLTACRREAVPELERQVSENLKLIAMEQARFSVRLETATDETPDSGVFVAGAEADDEFAAARATYWSPAGADRVEFWLSANPGESPRPLTRVASGGELSRLMLTLRTVCRAPQSAAGQESPRATLVFDEIDTGIGGRVAEVVGRRLKSLAASQQVFCVTHQPQIARFADRHYAVSKTFVGGRTVTTIRELTREERIGELSRMIGGEEDASAAREAARWLMESVGGPDSPSPRQSGAARGHRKTRSL